jgi:hypothetical protein
MAIQDWNTNDALNTTLEGIPTGEGAMTIPNINNLFRKMAATIKDFWSRAYRRGENVTIQATGGAAPATPADGDLFIEY